MYYAFGGYVLNTARRELSHAGESIPLEPKVYQILTYLIQHRDRLITREELLEFFWSDVYVTDSAVARCIGAVRKAVGDSREWQDVIQTRRGQGYRFVAAVVEKDETTMGPEGATAPEAILPDVRQPESVLLEDLECCGHCGAAITGYVAYCSACGHVLAIVADPDVAEDAHGTLVHPPVGERKPVTVLCGVLEMTSPLDLDTVDELMEALVPLVKRLVQPYGGYVDHFTSARLDVFFGVPESQEDHAERAVLAALALQRQWEALSTTFGLPTEAKVALRIGLHTGLVAVTWNPERLDVPLQIVGDVAPLAAQVALQAEASEVVVSRAVAPFIHDLVHLELQAPLLSANPFTLMPFYHVVSLSPEPDVKARWVGHPRSPFIGRKSELALLRTYLGRATAGQGQVVGIMGEPGMGKSRLLQAFRSDAIRSGAKVLTGYCQSYGTDAPYLALSHAVQQWVGIQERDNTAAREVKVRSGCRAFNVDPDIWIPSILHLLGTEGDSETVKSLTPQQCRGQTFAALYQLIAQSSQRQPLVVAIEDLHWVDPSTEAFLSSLAEAIDRLPVLLLVTYRSGYQPPWARLSFATQIALSPLSGSESLELITTVLQDRDLDRSAYRQIEAKAQGNPFFLEELARAFGAAEEDGAETLHIPYTVQTLLAARIDRLSPNAKYLLQIAAVFGSQVPLTSLQAVVAWPEATLNESLGQLRAAELLCESHLSLKPTYAFKHPLVQEVAYALLLRRTQRELYQRIVEVLTRTPTVLSKTQSEKLEHSYLTKAQNML